MGGQYKAKDMILILLLFVSIGSAARFANQLHRCKETPVVHGKLVTTNSKIRGKLM